MLPPIFSGLITWYVMHQSILACGICCSTHFTINREFAMSLQVTIYAKQNGAQMATFVATGTRADIDDLNVLRCRAWERGCEAANL